MNEGTLGLKKDPHLTKLGHLRLGQFIAEALA